MTICKRSIISEEERGIVTIVDFESGGQKLRVNNSNKHVMRSFIGLCLIMVSVFAWAQRRPFISSISPARANVGEVVTIVGSGFPTSTGNLQVKLGQGIATVTSIDENLIEVTVPANATHGVVEITDFASGAISRSIDKFAPSFGGESFAASSLSAPSDLATGENFIFDLCACDLDGDGLNDIVTTSRENNSGGKAKRKIYHNTSTLGSVSFSNVLNLGEKPAISVTCADLNGDGKPEIIATQTNDDNDTGTEDIEIYLNQSTSGNIAFSTTPTISFPLQRDEDGNIRRPFKIKTADFDLDGKLDLLVSDNSDETVHLYKNASSGSTLTFEDPFFLNIRLGDGLVAQGIEVGDFNKDDLTDVVAIPFEDNEFFIFENQSTSSGFNFKEPVVIAPGGQNNLRNVVAVDLNNDGFLDLAATDQTTSTTSSEIEITLNSTPSAGAGISFSDPTSFPATVNIWGIEAGDVDGDGDVDIIATSVSGENQFDILINDGASTPDFSRITVQTTDNNRHIRVTDINNDAKPDFVYTSDSRVNQNQGFLSYIVNNNCVVPVLSPTGEAYCPGNTLLVEASGGINLTYRWEVNTGSGTFNNVKENNENFLDISTFSSDLEVRVTAIEPNSGCSETSSVASYTLNNLTPPNPTINTTSDFCVGEEVVLSTGTTGSDLTYFWSGPNGFSETTTTASVTVTDSADPIDAGSYSLQVQRTGGCKSQSSSELVVVSAPPKPTVNVTGPENFCEGASTQLTTSEFPGFSIQWNIDGTAINSATGPALTADAGGSYTVTYTDQATNCTNTSLSAEVQEVAPPESSITSENEICVGVPLDFIGQTTSQNSQFTLEYTWVFLDGGTELGTDDLLATTFTFDNPGTYTARLTTGYQEIANCQSNTEQTITASSPPTIDITAVDGITKCPSDSVRLELPQGFSSYSWSTGASEFFAFAATEEDQDEVTVSADITTDIGCEASASITVSNFEDSGLDIITVTEGAERTGDVLEMPDGAVRIELEASGGSDYLWQPQEIFDDSTATRVTVTPRSPSTDIILSGTDVNGCDESESLTLVSNSVVGRKSFSPDGNNLGFDCWEIINSRELTGCTVYIFDKRGRNILVQPTPFENDCVWDGNIPSGQPAPEGVYYYVLKCDEGQNADFEQTGSILLARDND